MNKHAKFDKQLVDRLFKKTEDASYRPEINPEIKKRVEQQQKVYEKKLNVTINRLLDEVCTLKEQDQRE